MALYLYLLRNRKISLWVHNSYHKIIIYHLVLQTFMIIHNFSVIFLVSFEKLYILPCKPFPSSTLNYYQSYVNPMRRIRRQTGCCFNIGISMAWNESFLCVTHLQHTRISRRKVICYTGNYNCVATFPAECHFFCWELPMVFKFSSCTVTQSLARHFLSAERDFLYREMHLVI